MQFSLYLITSSVVLNLKHIVNKFKHFSRSVCSFMWYYIFKTQCASNRHQILFLDQELWTNNPIPYPLIFWYLLAETSCTLLSSNNHVSHALLVIIFRITQCSTYARRKTDIICSCSFLYLDYRFIANNNKRQKKIKSL